MKNKGHIEYIDATHVYTNMLTKERYKSVTTYISSLKEPFDSTGNILKYSAKKMGVTEEELKQIWNNKNKKSTIRGTYIHNIIERFFLESKSFVLKNKKVVYLYNNDTTEYEKELIREVPFDYLLTLRKKKCKKHVEDILWSDTLKMAGQSDLVLEYKDYIEIYDWKTNDKPTEDLLKTYNKFKFLFTDVPQCSMYEYYIQLCIYSLFAEAYYGKPCKNMYIIHIYKGYKEIHLEKSKIDYIIKKLKTHWNI